MTVTLEIDDEALARAKELALRESKRLDDMVSELILQGLEVSATRDQGDPKIFDYEGELRIPVFRVPTETPILTDSKIKEMLDQH